MYRFEINPLLLIGIFILIIIFSATISAIHEINSNLKEIKNIIIEENQEGGITF